MASEQDGLPQDPPALCCGWKRKIILRYLAIATMILVLGSLPPMSWILFDRWHQEIHIIGWFIAGVFTLLTVPLCLFGIILHLNHYHKPRIQRYVIRILWMPLVYGLTSWLSLIRRDHTIYLETFRGFYEAYVIYSFAFFLMATLSAGVGPSEDEVDSSLLSVEPLEEPSVQSERELMQSVSAAGKGKHMTHMWPLCCLPEWSLEPRPRGDSVFLSRCKHGVVSYVVCKLFTSALAFILEQFEVYGEGEIDPHRGYLYVVILDNCAQMWALYCLVLFYHTYKEELAPCKPLPKFMSIKLVVFFSFWQSVLISVLVYVDVIHAEANWSFYNVKNVATGLQNFIICIEMFFATWGHLYAFSHDDYKQMGEKSLSMCDKFRTIFDISDVQEDVMTHGKLVVRGVGKAFSPRKKN